MSEDYASRRAKIGRRAEKAPLEGRPLAKNYPRDGRLHYPWYQTMYEHEPSDPHKRRHETIRNIYLWNVPAEKRADKPKIDATRQKHFETKYRSMLKDRADREWSRKYYYPRDDYAQPHSSSSRKCDRCEAREKHQDFMDRYSSSSSSYSHDYAPSYQSSYSRTSSSTQIEPTTPREPTSERNRQNRSVREIPSLEASKSSRRLERYLSDNSSSSRTEKRTQASETSSYTRRTHASETSEASETPSYTRRTYTSETSDTRRTHASSSSPTDLSLSDPPSSNNGHSSSHLITESSQDPPPPSHDNHRRSRLSSSSSSSSRSSASSQSDSVEHPPQEHPIVESIPSQSILLEETVQASIDDDGHLQHSSEQQQQPIENQTTPETTAVGVPNEELIDSPPSDESPLPSIDPTSEDINLGETEATSESAESVVVPSQTEVEVSLPEPESDAPSVTEVADELQQAIDTIEEAPVAADT